MRIIFGIIGCFLRMPMPVRILFEMVIVLLCMFAVWPVIRRVFAFVLQIIGIVSLLFITGCRWLICLLGKGSGCVYELDEKIGQQGRKVDALFEERVKYFKQSKVKEVLIRKSSIIIIIAVYVVAILPCFQLENMIAGEYLHPFYCINDFVLGIEGYMANESAKYPPLFSESEVLAEAAEVDSASEAVVETEVEEKIQIYLVLSTEVSYANVRKEPSRNGKGIAIVSKEDVILYQNECKYDGERYWLKVSVETQGNIEGWISEKVIEHSIIDMLQLP